MSKFTIEGFVQEVRQAMDAATDRRGAAARTLRAAIDAQGVARLELPELTTPGARQGPLWGVVVMVGPRTTIAAVSEPLDLRRMVRTASPGE